MNSRKMITFDHDNRRFSFRAVAVIIEESSILLHKSGEQDFWSLPGGRVELGETAAETVIREMNEEIGIELKLVRLLWIVENFFNHENKNYHELSMFFLISENTNQLKATRGTDFTSTDNGISLLFKWFPICSLQSVPLYPVFLRKGLTNLPNAPEYFKHKDE